MGEVYLAQDLDLKRSVALKILPAELADDPERLARFRREAESLAAISHPNIVTIFSIEQVGDLHILTMERIEGRGLDELLPENGMPVEQLLEIAISLCAALAAAHEKGITHRDLKPANLMLTEDGRLKVLDFGLAKLQAQTTSQASASDSEPLLTREEAIIGTAPYMSPEQIENADVDGRSDLFCFGTVLYELATGQRPFQGRSAPAVMSAILQKEPRPIHELRKDLPRGLEQIITRCLEKDPAERYQTATEVQTDLEALLESPSSHASWHPAHWPKALQWVVAAMLVLAVGLLSWQVLFQDAAAAGPPGVAVLSFKNLGPKDDAHLAGGMRDGIVSRLSSVAGLKVIFPPNAKRYDEMPARQIGEELRVGYLLYGSVSWENKDKDKERQVFITPFLARAHDGEQLPMKSYTRVIKSMDDILAVHRDIANQVVDRLGITLAAADRESIGAGPTDNLEAYQLYQRAQFFHEQRNEESNRKALECYEQAVVLDKNYALALCGMARVWSFKGWYCRNAPGLVYAEAQKWLAKAFAVDPELPEYWANHAILGLNYDLDFAKGGTEFQNAIRFAPKYSRFPKGYPTAHHWYGGILSAEGRHEDALKQGLIAQRLDPVSPIITTWVGLRYYFAGRYQEAVKEIDKALFMDPQFAPGQWHQSWALAQVGRHPDAITAARKAYSISKNPLYKTSLAWAHALNKERDEARRLLRELEELGKTHFVSSYHLATVHVALEDKDRAFERLEKAHRERDPWRQYLKIDPRLIPLRDDPRFKPLAKRMGF